MRCIIQVWMQGNSFEKPGTEPGSRSARSRGGPACPSHSSPGSRPDPWIQPSTASSSSCGRAGSIWTSVSFPSMKMPGRSSNAAPTHRPRNAWIACSRASICSRPEGRPAVVTDFRPQEILRVLDRHGVRYVLVGGLAAVLHGATHVTTDVDVVPEDAQANLERLSEALRELHARIRTTGETHGIPFDRSGESLSRVRVWNLQTAMGDLDITFQPSGTRGYDDLRRDVVTMEIRGVEVPVASLADVVRSKEAAGRARDRAVLPALRELLARQRRAERT